jgi:hypothetical protein
MDQTRITELLDDFQADARKFASDIIPDAEKIGAAVRRIGSSWSGSTLGHHSEIYYRNFQRPPLPFNAEWGTQMGMPEGWYMPTVEEVESAIVSLSGVDLTTWKDRYETARTRLSDAKAALVVELPSSTLCADEKLRVLVSRIEEVRFDDSHAKEYLLQQLNAHRSSVSRDLRAISAGGVILPTHLCYDALVGGARHTQESIQVIIKEVNLLLRYLELHKQSDAVEAPVEMHNMLSQLTNDPLTLRKLDGTTQPFRGRISRNTVITFDSKLPIREGDVVERDLPNGETEQFEIVDAGFQSGYGGIQAHYQMKVRKVTGRIDLRASAAPVTNIYNVHGPNARINNQSIDQSHNLVGVGEDELFQKLKDVIQSAGVETSQRDLLLKSVDEMHASAGQSTFASKFQSFIALAANCITVVTPFLPALANLAASAR